MKIETVIEEVPFKDSMSYWRLRYHNERGISGEGSYGKYADEKRAIINKFIKKAKIKKLIDFGCGDANVASGFNISEYIGLDISPEIVVKNIKQFRNDDEKIFLVYDCTKPMVFNAELVISFDVIFHLVERNVFETYMRHLFKMSSKYVIILSTNKNKNEKDTSPHVKNRKFTDYIKQNIGDWYLAQKIESICEKNLYYYLYAKKMKKFKYSGKSIKYPEPENPNERPIGAQSTKKKGIFEGSENKKRC